MLQNWYQVLWLQILISRNSEQIFCCDNEGCHNVDQLEIVSLLTDVIVLFLMSYLMLEWNAKTLRCINASNINHIFYEIWLEWKQGWYQVGKKVSTDVTCTFFFQFIIKHAWCCNQSVVQTVIFTVFSWPCLSILHLRIMRNVLCSRNHKLHFS